MACHRREAPGIASGVRNRVWRLRPHGEFERVRRTGRSWSHQLLVVIALPRDASPGDRPRVAVAVGKRLGNAVIRNRIKRRMRKAVQQAYPYLPANIDLIVMARAPIIGASVVHITEALIEVLQRAHSWTGPSTGQDE